MENTAQQLQTIANKVGLLQQTNLQQFQKQILGDLYKLKELLLNDIKKASFGASNGSDVQKDNTIKRLEEENKKQAYRITHLTKNLAELLPK